jgi:hypothetical protein
LAVFTAIRFGGRQLVAVRAGLTTISVATVGIIDIEGLRDSKHKKVIALQFVAVTSKKIGEKAGAVSAAIDDLLYSCPACKTVYEIVRHRVRPPAEPVCAACQRDLPVADDSDWLTYRRTLPRFERTG